MLTLFRCATGEGWNGLMHDAMTTEQEGRCSEASGDCGSWAAIPFFVSYAILSTLSAHIRASLPSPIASQPPFVVPRADPSLCALYR